MKLFQNSSRPWWVNGLIFAAWMFVGMTLIFSYLIGEPITSNRLIIGALVWSVIGLAYGYAMKNSQGPQRKEKP
jgi:hypothetical protein